MRRKIVGISFITMGFIITTNLFAIEIEKKPTVGEGREDVLKETTTNRVEGKPVDEGVKSVIKEDRIKGSTTITNKFTSKTESLIAIQKDDIYSINISKVSHLPITCRVMRGDKEVLKFQEKKKNIVFDINSSLLKVDDNITIFNRYKAIGEILIRE